MSQNNMVVPKQLNSNAIEFKPSQTMPSESAPEISSIPENEEIPAMDQESLSDITEPQTTLTYESPVSVFVPPPIYISPILPPPNYSFIAIPIAPVPMITQLEDEYS